MLRLLYESAFTQLSQGVAARQRRQPRHLSTAHRDYDLAPTLSYVPHVAAELIMELTNSDFALERVTMWRHGDDFRRYIAIVN